MKKTPLIRKTPLARSRKPMNRVSKAPHRLARRNIPASTRKLLHKRSNGRCEFWLRVDFDKEGLAHWTPTHASDPRAQRRCENIATDAHHLLKKSRGGSNELNNLLHGCRSCHNWTEAHDTQAVDRGTSKLAGRSL